MKRRSSRYAAFALPPTTITPIPALPFSRRWHRRLGIALLLPFCGWAATGLVFFFKPGYAGAYAQLEPRWLALDTATAARSSPSAPQPGWLETRHVHTVLGEHLLVRTATGHLHLRAETGAAFPEPAPSDLARLVADAIAVDAERYGELRGAPVARDGVTTFTTTTGIEIAVDWPRLGLRQSGRDTALIDTLYRIHYLQWTGIAAFDRAFGLLGLLGLLALALLGLRLAVR